MFQLKPILLAASIAALSACTTPPPRAPFPTPPEMLMRAPLELRSLPSPAQLPTITADVAKTQSN